jgi:VanZ family protein
MLSLQLGTIVLIFIVNMTPPSIFVTSLHYNFYELYAYKSNLPKWYEKELSKCIRMKFD